MMWSNAARLFAPNSDARLAGMSFEQISSFLKTLKNIKGNLTLMKLA